MDHWAALILSAGALAIGCSESELRTVFEAPEFFDQPDALGPTEWRDTFQQRTVAASDILFVVDSSGSMGDEQEELAANFERFISAFQDSSLDFHIGVVDGAVEQEDRWGRLVEVDGARWIDNQTADPVARFTTMANVGVDGFGECEMALQQSFSALESQSNPGRWNEGFYREDALLSVIVISDEDDHGDDGNQWTGMCDGIAVSEYIPWLEQIKGFGDADQVIFTGIVGDRPDGCSVDDNSAQYGAAYWEVIDALGGNFFSICSPDWGDFLVELGLEAAGLKQAFHLRRVPDVDTILVRLDGEEADPSTWEYDPIRNAVTFPTAHIPLPLVTIEVTYILVEDQGGGASR
jgi:hypothetical protein